MENLKKGDSIKISTISQIAELSEEQFDQFIFDLRAWYNFRKAAEQVNKIARASGLDQDAVQMPNDYIDWVWDDSNKAEINLSVISEDGVERFKDKYSFCYGEPESEADNV